MVCLGNICRSPMAEGMLRHLAMQRSMTVRTDSAGTSNFHVGEAPDTRAVQCMAGHGIDIRDLRARQFVAGDLDRFDRVFVMDRSNLQHVRHLLGGREDGGKVSLIMDLLPGHPLREVPDPYYGGDQGFEQVYAMLDQACSILLDELR
ncbi:MAG: low molecular weight phosphotyrosine protein phosphatase [Flavobacteriales bacterium]|nr:low molecular weight phosphotyrosine protein phosphatase [Flavobacteriales bacterium]